MSDLVTIMSPHWLLLLCERAVRLVLRASNGWGVDLRQVGGDFGVGLAAYQLPRTRPSIKPSPVSPKKALVESPMDYGAVIPLHFP